MAINVNSLPLLHKYVLQPEDDMELKLAKLKYRLCVKEVSDVLLTRLVERGTDISEIDRCEEQNNFSIFATPPSNLKSDDSGIGIDLSFSDDNQIQQLQSPTVFKITEEDHESDTRHIIEEDMSASSSSSSTSSQDDSRHLCHTRESYSDDENETYQMPSVHASGDGDFEDDNDDNDDDDAAKDGFFRNVHAEPQEKRTSSVVEPEIKRNSVAPKLFHDRNIDIDEEPQNVDRYANSQKGIMMKKCTDVDEALRILKSHHELSEIAAHKSVLTWSRWNIADIVRGPHESSSLWRNSSQRGLVAGQRRRFQETLNEETENQERKNSQELRATNERILMKEKKLADLFQKIVERDEEDERMLKEFMSKPSVPSAEPLPFQQPAPPLAPSSSSSTAAAAENQKRQSSERDAGEQPGRKKPVDGGGGSAAPEEPAKRKKQGNIFHNVVSTLQRRFSSRRKSKP